MHSVVIHNVKGIVINKNTFYFLSISFVTTLVVLYILSMLLQQYVESISISIVLFYSIKSHAFQQWSMIKLNHMSSLSSVLIAG